MESWSPIPPASTQAVRLNPSKSAYGSRDVVRLGKRPRTRRAMAMATWVENCDKMESVNFSGCNVITTSRKNND